jgi:hypothetical protein
MTTFCSFDDFADAIRAQEGCELSDFFLDNYDTITSELADTGSVTVVVGGEVYELTINIRRNVCQS